MAAQTYQILNPANPDVYHDWRKQEIKYGFENFCIMVSLVGPILIILYFVLSSHIYLHYNSISNNSAREMFILLYRNELAELAKLLFAGSIFSGIGVLLSGVHENSVIFAYSLFCFFISIGFFLPTLIMYNGG